MAGDASQLQARVCEQLNGGWKCRYGKAGVCSVAVAVGGGASVCVTKMVSKAERGLCCWICGLAWQ